MAALLSSLLRQQLEKVILAEIIVVSSASTDKTDEIVKEFAKKDARISLITEDKRNGKSSAINLFIKKATSDVLLIESGDTIPALNTIEKMCEPFLDEKIGMTGGRPVPENTSKTFVGYTVNLLWRLHHRLAKLSPKLGEMIAFRRCFDQIPPNSAVDEASIEAIILHKGYKLFYAEQAIIHNKGPEDLKGFIKQRRRIAAGHYWLKKNQHYVVSSNHTGLLKKITLQELKENFDIRLFFAMGLELYCRFLGFYDFYIRKQNPYAWEIVASTKNLKKKV